MYPATPATLPVLHPGTSLFFPVTANVLTATQAMNYISSPTPDVTVRPDRGFSDITPSASQHDRYLALNAFHLAVCGLFLAKSQPRYHAANCP